MYLLPNKTGYKKEKINIPTLISLLGLEDSSAGKQLRRFAALARGSAFTFPALTHIKKSSMVTEDGWDLLATDLAAGSVRETVPKT